MATGGEAGEDERDDRRGALLDEQPAERGLQLSGTTVKTQVTRVLMKLGPRDRVQAVVLAYESGLVTPGCGDG